MKSKKIRTQTNQPRQEVLSLILKINYSNAFPPPAWNSTEPAQLIGFPFLEVLQLISYQNTSNSQDMETGEQQGPLERLKGFLRFGLKPQKIALTETPVDYLIEHQEKVAEKFRNLFLQIDSLAAKIIGYNGCVLEEVYRYTKAKDQDENPPKLPPEIAKYFDPYFFIRIDKGESQFFYRIYENGSPEIEICFPDKKDNNCLYQYRLTAFVTCEGLTFNRCKIEKYRRRKDDGSLLEETTLRLFDPGAPLIISRDISSMKTPWVKYNNLDKEGNLSIKNGQMISLKTSTGTDFDGRLSVEKPEKPVTWEDQIPRRGREEPRSSIHDGKLSISYFYDTTLEFPLKVNLHTLLEQIFSEANLSPFHPPPGTLSIDKKNRAATI